jgi:fructokinase
MSRALVIGEALIDIVERGHERASSTARDVVSTEHVGGSPLNVAIGLGRLGRDVDFLTHIGRDERGARIVDYVEASGVQLVSGSQDAAHTPTALARLDDGGAASYVFDIEWALTGTPEAAAPLVAHTGSIAAYLEPGCLATAALLDAYRTSATVTYDPNVRPALIADHEQARTRIERLVARADVVKASDEDLRWIDPTIEPARIAEMWLGLGPAMVAVTMGGQGAFAMCAAGTVRVPAPPVEVVDTVGAGDSFMTGLIDALWTLGLLGADKRRQLAGISLDDLQTAATAAAKVAAVTVTRAGADLPDRAALQ